MYVSLNSGNIIELASPTPVQIRDKTLVSSTVLDQYSADDLLGKRLVEGPAKNSQDLRIALICNWGDRCGIATYTNFLVNALRPKVKEIRIFAEDVQHESDDAADNALRCWKRGESMIPAIQKVLEWKPDLVFIQHEFGIFPKATHFLKMLEMLSDTPYALTMHSVYEHLDKSVCTAYIKNLICHSEQGKTSLRQHGFGNNIYVISHGCVQYDDPSELWNIFQNDYTVMQFGFGFSYKGVDHAIEAIRLLKRNPKFKNIFYCYLCSESNHTRIIQNEYYKELRAKIESLDLDENIVVLRGYLSEQYLCNFMRTAKLAIFPYKNNPNNIVYGASGAIRKAMACGVPIIASDSHMFDDLEGVLPRPSTPEGLAQEIDRVFSDCKYRNTLRFRNLQYVKDHRWEVIGDQHIRVFQQILDQYETSVVRVPENSVETH